MNLPKDDEDYLAEKGFQWELLSSVGDGCLVIKDYPTSKELYDQEKVDLMIRIPGQYNMAGLDMFYACPPLKLLASHDFPIAANNFENHVGRQWQRFSRHLAEPWKSGIDGLPMFMAIIQKELQGKN